MFFENWFSVLNTNLVNLQSSSLGKSYLLGNGVTLTVKTPRTCFVMGIPTNDSSFIARVTPTSATAIVGTIPSTITISAESNVGFTIRNTIGWNVVIMVIGINIE